jgi:hypothetical protein
LFAYLWMKIVNTPEENPSISVEEAYIDAYAYDDVVGAGI